MNFIVKFKSKFNYSVNVYPIEVGLHGLDFARRESGVEKLSPDLVSAEAGGVWENPTIEVDEDYARRSGHFRNVNVETVYIPRGSLDRFLNLVPVIQRSEKTGEMVGVQWRRELDTQAILELWEDDYFPLEWFPDGSHD